MDLSYFKTIVQQGISHWFLPYHCILCSEETNRNLDLCIECEESLPWLGNVCSYCAAPLYLSKHTVCGACLTKPLSFSKVCLFFSYTTIIKRMIIRLKFERCLFYAHLLGTLLAKHLERFYYQERLPQLIIPVPLHKKRLSERGYNQALELAKPIRKRFKIPIDFSSCLRLRNTAAQASLTADQRRSNVKNAFTVHKKIHAQHIALLDDVMTTGHTLIELSRILYHAGVKRIDVWCCARTFLSSF